MPTRSELMRFAPKARPGYIDAILNGEEHLRKAGILHHPLTWCHWIAQCSAETGNFTIWTENMNYRSVERIRQVWPARARKTPEAELAKLVNNPVGLSAWAYNGRMSNRKGTDDGFTYRGRGFLQVTGRHAYQKYAQQLGVSLTQKMDEDYDLSLQFAILEWVSSGCNSLALENDLLGISRAINVGSAKSGVMPNGLEHRRAALKRAWTIWGDPARPKVPEVSSITKDALKKLGSDTLAKSDLVKTGAIVGGIASGTAGAASESGTVVTIPNVPTQQAVEQANDALRTTTESVTLGSDFVVAIKSFWLLISTNLWAVGIILACVAYYFARQIDWRRLLDARTSSHIGHLDDLPPVEDSILDDPEQAVIPRG